MALKINHKGQKITKLISAAIITALVLVMGKILLWENSYYKEKTYETRASSAPVVTKVAKSIAPSEATISKEEHDNYQSSSSEPRYLRIPRLGIDTIVKHGNISGDELPVPSNIYETTWYSGSDIPGKDGCVIISGLWRGFNKEGIFFNLESLEREDTIEVEVGGGNRYVYSVIDIQLVNSDEISKALPEAQKRVNERDTLVLVTAKHSVDRSDYGSVAIIRASITEVIKNE